MQTRIAPGLDGWIAADQQRRAGEEHALRQQVGQQRLRGLLMEQAQHQEAVRREAQMRADVEALGPNPDPRAVAQVASKYATPQQLLAYHSKEAAAAPQRQGQQQLAALLSTGGYQAPPGTPATDGAAGPADSVALSDAEAIARIQAAGGRPMSVNVPNPANVQAAAVQADPARAIPKILEMQKPPPVMTEYQQRYLDIQQQRADQAANRPAPAPSFIVTQDKNSPTGWSHKNTRTGELSPGAPPPASVAPKPPRPMPAPLQKQLTEAAEVVDATERFVGTFKDNYGGKTVTGDLGNQWGKIFGDDTGQAQWWQDYELHQSQIRNKLFGSALTTAEIEAWNKSAINPRMNSGEIRKNLARREMIERKGYAKLTNFAERSGFPREQIEALTGRPIGGAPASPPTGGGWSIRPIP